MKLPKIKSNGFTLIELLIALTIVTILAIAVYAALNPASRIKAANNARRASDIDQILTAIHQSIVDNKGLLPSNLPTAGGAEKQLGSATSLCTYSTGNSGITTTCGVAATADCTNLLTGTRNLSAYLKSMPVDPTGGTAALSKYSVEVDANNIVTVKACNTEQSDDTITSVISASR